MLKKRGGSIFRKHAKINDKEEFVNLGELC